MSKRKSSPELYLAFHMGFTVKDLLTKGYSKATVYNYHRNYKKRVRPAFDGLLKTTQLNS